MNRRRYGIVDGKRVMIRRFRGCDGFDVKWTASCSGCFESEDGYPCGDYPKHPVHGCYIGSGCDECGYRGIRRRVEWVPMDYDVEKYFKAMEREYAVESHARRGGGHPTNAGVSCDTADGPCACGAWHGARSGGELCQHGPRAWCDNCGGGA